MEIAIDMAGLLDMIISHSGAIPASRPAVYRGRGAAKEVRDTRDKWVVYFPTEVLNRAQLTQGVADAIRSLSPQEVVHVAYSIGHGRGASQPLCLKLLAQAGQARPDEPPKEESGASPRPLWTCPQCGGAMVLIERLSPVQLRLRSPPVPQLQQL